MQDTYLKRDSPPPKLLSFELRGLHGYKNLAIECNDPASIILAENGVGKTTLLNTLYALLSGRISRLFSLDFQSAILEFPERRVEFKREDAFKATDTNDSVSLLRNRAALEFMEYGVKPEQLFDLVRVYSEGNRELVRRSRTFNRLYQTSPLDHEDIFMRLEQLRSVMCNNLYITEFRKQVSQAMGDVTVFYLPTYRRIEALKPLSMILQ
jgi:predicted ATP-dependent endonuclease of OLD family